MKVIYTQEVMNGIGILEVDGKRIENLKWVHIIANTNAEEPTFPTIEFAHYEGDKLVRDRIPGGL